MTTDPLTGEPTSRPENPDDLLYSLRWHGFHLWLEDGRLWINPAPRLTAEQRADVRTHRDALVALLEREAHDLAPLASHWVCAEPTTVRPAPWEPPPVAAVDPDLASWFRAALATGLLPERPFQLQKAVLVTEPARLYGWITERLDTPGASAVGAECERLIRRLREIVEEQP